MTKRKYFNGNTTLEELMYQGCTLKELADLLTNLEKQSDTDSDEKKEKLIVRISDILQELGMPTHIIGYRYLRYCIMEAYKHDEYLYSTMNNYRFIAELFNVTVENAERCIRHAITVTWDRGDMDAIVRLFGNSVDSLKGKPTNSEFIAKIVDILYLQDEKEK